MIVERVGKCEVVCSNTLEYLKTMKDESVDMIITSPPYYALRKYPDDCVIEWGDGTKCQLGLEPTPDLYVKHLSMIIKELYRVLKKEGVFFLNIGDTYSNDKFNTDVPRKGLLAIPERVLLECMKTGFIRRNTIIWHKPNSLPIPFKDRLANTFEYVYVLVKNKKYYFNLDAIREQYDEKTIERIKTFIKNNEKFSKERHKYDESGFSQAPSKVRENAVKSFVKFNYNRLELKYGEMYTVNEKEISEYEERPKCRKFNFEKNTVRLPPSFSNEKYLEKKFNDINFDEIYDLRLKNPGDVWTLTTEPFKENHFAIFPRKLVARCIACACPENGTILDPFFGSGTVGVVSELFNTRQFDKIPKFDEICNPNVVKKMDWNIKCIGIEIVKKYFEMSVKRIKKEVYESTKPLSEWWCEWLN